MHRKLLFWLLMVPGGVAMAGFGYGCLLDWGQLRKNYQYYRVVSANPASFQKLFIAESAQNIHRLNLFADGVWFLLAGVIFAIGLHGWCVLGESNSEGTSGHRD